MVAACCAALGARGELVRVEFAGTQIEPFIELAELLDPMEVLGYFEYDSNSAPRQLPENEPDVISSLAPTSRFGISLTNAKSPLPSTVDVAFRNIEMSYRDPRAAPSHFGSFWPETPVTTALLAFARFQETSTTGPGSWVVSLSHKTTLPTPGDFRQLGINSTRDTVSLYAVWLPNRPVEGSVNELDISTKYFKFRIDSIRVVPEPATATLSLLASAAGFFVARRGRPG